MKTALRNIFAYALASLARTIIRIYKPTVLMVTGSVGKTSTKDAVAAALSARYEVRKSEKSFNSELGVPLTIIGVKNPWTNPLAWMGVFLEAARVILFRGSYPELLVLEVGADKPGDLAGIVKIVRPDAVVVTSLPAVPVHVEAYATPAAVREEEFSPVHALAAGERTNANAPARILVHTPLIYSADDEYIGTYAHDVDVKKITFGYADGAGVRIIDVDIWTEDGKLIGMRGTIEMLGTSYPLHVRGAFGKTQLYAPVAALASAVAFGITPKEAFEGLESYVSPAGRGRLFAGVKDSIIIDDSYNSSPAATEEALASLALISSARRRIVVLGDMLELGRYSEAEHVRMLHLAAQVAQLIVTVGNRMRDAAGVARQDDESLTHVQSYDTSIEAAEHLPDLLEEGDIVLIKGSQGVRTERIVKAVLADANDARNLVRQEHEWHKR